MEASTETGQVIARCSPESKVKMIRLLHAQKKYVAMTGDGVRFHIPCARKQKDKEIY